MIGDIKGIHHISTMGRDAGAIDRFATGTLGLRRVKKTVNFDEPSVYHLYYGDTVGTPGGVMTYFPFPRIARGRPGTGEVGETAYAVPEGSLGYWKDRLHEKGAAQLSEDVRFGAPRLRFAAPDGDRFVLVEVPGDSRAPHEGGDVPAEVAIRGFQGATLRLRETAATEELLTLMGYRKRETEGVVTRYALEGGNGADIIDLQALPAMEGGALGAGSVHHIAFAVPDAAAQLAARARLHDAGFETTPVIDRDYFLAIYFRTPGGVLFEIATDEPGFLRDEDIAHLGQALKLPSQHEHLREQLESDLPEIG